MISNHTHRGYIIAIQSAYPRIHYAITRDINCDNSQLSKDMSNHIHGYANMYPGRQRLDTYFKYPRISM
jgi:hypothetical protein